MNEQASLLPIALSVGCPSGIGPEVAVEALRGFPHPVTLVGDRAQLTGLAAARGVSLEGHSIHQPGPPLPPEARRPGHPTREGGAAQLLWVDAACDLASRGQARALATGPVSKETIATSGAPGSEGFLGHTEHLQRRLGAREVVMCFWSPGLSCSLVTTHLPLSRVPAAVTPEAVEKAAFWLGWLLARLAPGTRPRVVIAGLNPHAGENGLLGDEETRVIGPGIERARQRAAAAGVEVEFIGPRGAESAFRLARDRVYAGVVAMYHDQATIPMKLLGFGEAVNVSLGLPILRTSVDHGTAYDAAGSGKASARGMREALDLAHLLSAAGYATGMSGAEPSHGG
jgi:4-hydroxythreonine-4-phosphate dehydrogenase